MMMVALGLPIPLTRARNAYFLEISHVTFAASGQFLPEYSLVYDFLEKTVVEHGFFPLIAGHSLLGLYKFCVCE